MRPRSRTGRLLVAAAALVVLAGGGVALAVALRGGDRESRRTTTRRVFSNVMERGHAQTRPKPQRPRLAHHSRPVPILMYHQIAAAPPAERLPGLFVRPAVFRRQIAWLAAHGYHGVTLQRVFDYWRRGVPLPRKPIVLSFDDGYHSQFSVAMPVLRARRWPGVLNLHVTNLRAGVVRGLIRAGWELDSHTFTHSDLREETPAGLRYDVVQSRRFLRRRYKTPVNFFCYPSGRYDARVIRAVKAAGYLGATSTEYGLARPSDPWSLDRIRISGSDGVAGLVAKLRTLERA